jgi:hypothetical protein
VIEGSKVGPVAFIGIYLPRKCGIATLISGLPTAVGAKHSASECFSVSMNDINEGYEYRDVVRFEIEDQDLSSYLRAADFRNISNVDVACWQHEFVAPRFKRERGRISIYHRGARYGGDICRLGATLHCVQNLERLYSND